MKHIDFSLLSDAFKRDEGAADDQPAAAECATCGGFRTIGYRYTDASRQNVVYIPCPDCATQRTADRRRSLSGLDTPEHRGKTFDCFTSTLPGVAEAFSRCRDYAANPRGWLLLDGPYGTGKSHLAIAIGHAALASGAAVVFATTPDMLDQLRAAYDKGEDETYTQRLERLRGADLLILDDVGTQNDTAWAREKLFQIINHRYNIAAPTVFTTNQPLSALGGRLESRLSDVALVERLDFSGAQDHRRLGFAQRRAS